MPFSKIAHTAALEKVAAADALEQRDAIDAGFEQACDTLELNDLQRANLAKFAAVVLDVAKPTMGLAKVAADIVGNAAPAGDPNAELFKQRLVAEQAKAKAFAEGQARAAGAGQPPAAPPVKPVGAGGSELFDMMGGMTGPDISPPPAPKPVTPAVKPPVAPAPPVKPVVAPKPVVPPSPAPPVIPGAK